MGGNNGAYTDLLVGLWGQRRRLLLIEHDIEIHDRVIPTALHCPFPWCVWPYSGPKGDGLGDSLLYQSLGCTKFSGSLMKREPDVMNRVSAAMRPRPYGVDDDGLGTAGWPKGLDRGDWRRLDATLAPALRWLGYEPHIHWPAVLHHHVYPGEGCACGQEHA